MGHFLARDNMGKTRYRLVSISTKLQTIWDIHTMGALDFAMVESRAQSNLQPFFILWTHISYLFLYYSSNDWFFAENDLWMMCNECEKILESK